MKLQLSSEKQTRKYRLFKTDFDTESEINEVRRSPNCMQRCIAASVPGSSVRCFGGDFFLQSTPEMNVIDLHDTLVSGKLSNKTAFRKCS